jgi:hypothetical protein
VTTESVEFNGKCKVFNKTLGLERQSFDECVQTEISPKDTTASGFCKDFSHEDTLSQRFLKPVALPYPKHEKCA